MYQPLIRESGSLSCSRASNLEEVSSGQTGASADDASNSEKTRSCRSDELKKIKDQLTSRSPSNLKVVTIVGMGGIGKTTLAKTIYEDIEISYHFHLCAWITVSQEYKLRNIFLGLLRSMDSDSDELSKLENEELEERLSKCLKGRRFLIVLDDIWNAQSWNDFKRIIPDENNGSRVLMTSRHMGVARDAEPNSPPHCMNCLSREESWTLLRNEVFRGKPCPSDMFKIGQEIANKCQGLPLALVVVAAHLSQIDRKQECWADVAKRLESLITGNQGQILDILFLSYNYLPLRLKACFLYMGIFPKNSRIHVRKLIRLWIAVGFVHSEHEAEKCLEDLINRNLIMVGKKKCDGTVKTCGIHDLLWDLSLREARKEGYHIFRQFNFIQSQFNSTGDDMNHLMDLTSSYRYLGDYFVTGFPLSSICFRLLRVLDIQSKLFDVFPETITNLFGLRYLELHTLHISESISKLCNLETLINRYKGLRALLLPKEVWLLRHLRHLQAGKVKSETRVGCNYFVSALPDDLQTLSTVSFASCKQLVFSRIPNLKRLKICDIDGEEDEYLFSFLNNLIYFRRLEKLNLHFSRAVRRSQQVPLCKFFPSSVKQLTLSGSYLLWEDMDILAMLPNIEVLKLKRHAFKGPVYEQTVEGFPRLKVLLFEELDLKQWIAETMNYPILQHLVLRHCFSLEAIPDCFGEIQTLESIELVSCAVSAQESAKAIKQEQENMGNDLQVRIYYRISTSMANLRREKGLRQFLRRIRLARQIL